VDPERDGSEVRVVEVLDRAPSRIEQRFAGDAQTRAWLYDTVGQAYFGLEQYDRALPVLERAVELRRDLDGLSSRESLAVHAHWAEALHGTLQLDRAGVELERSLELRRRALGESDRDTLDSLQLYTSWLDHVGRRADAIERAGEGLERSRAAFGDDDELTVAFKASLAMALTGDVQKLSPADRRMLQERALPLFEEVVRWRRAHRPDAPDTLSAIHNLAQAYWQLDRLDEAEPLLGEACDGLARTLGPDAPGTMIALGTLGSLQHSRGCLDDADASYRRAHAGLEAAWGARHPETLVVAYNLACLLRERSRLDEAAQWAREAAEGRSETLGADHPLALRAAWQQAEILRELGRRGEALAVYAALLEVAEAALPPDDPRLATYRAGRAACTAP
jgi:tetratricopeptide (TPR) repeat protein